MTISTPTFRLAQTRSAVTTGHPSLSPRAKQARSPSDSPACRVMERNRAAMRACGPSKGTTCKSIAETAVCAWASFRPSSCNFDSTSQTLTALMVAPTSRRGSTLLNGSFFSAASIADASATISSSFTRRLFAPLGNQLGHQVTAGTMASYDPLRLSQCLFLRAYAQFPFADRLNNQLIAGLQTRGGAAFGWNDNSALLVDPGLSPHDISPYI